MESSQTRGRTHNLGSTRMCWQILFQAVLKLESNLTKSTWPGASAACKTFQIWNRMLSQLPKSNLEPTSDQDLKDPSAHHKRMPRLFYFVLGLALPQKYWCADDQNKGEYVCTIYIIDCPCCQSAWLNLHTGVSRICIRETRLYGISFQPRASLLFKNVNQNVGHSIVLKCIISLYCSSLADSQGKFLKNSVCHPTEIRFTSPRKW